MPQQSTGFAILAVLTQGHLDLLQRLLDQRLGRQAAGLGIAFIDGEQHILIGAYCETLALMRLLGVDIDQALQRLPLTLIKPDGLGLELTATSSPAAFCAAVLRHHTWSWASKLGLLLTSTGWALQGFRCTPGLTVAALTHRLPMPVRRDLIDPLCVAALNTPAASASAQVFLRVLRDALIGGTGSADLLLPRQSLDDLLPGPASRWLKAHGADIRLRQRVTRLSLTEAGWEVLGQRYEHVVMACTAREAARLALDHQPEWARSAQGLPHEAITTVYLEAAGARLSAAMVFLPEGPAQFAFDHGALGMTPGRLAFVISAAADYQDLTRDQLGQSVLHQAATQFPPGTWLMPPRVVGVVTERRATFRCEPGLDRPPAKVAPGLWAAGDYVAGPYPATLEGAVRSGQQVIEQLAGPAFAMQNSDSNCAKP